MQGLVRFLKIVCVIARYRLDNLINSQHLSNFSKCCYYLLPWRFFISVKESRAVRIRKSLEDLGPVFIKFGQILSTRKDLLPEDISIELSKLQDQVPPFSSEKAIAIVESEFNQTIDELFAQFDSQPMASASVAQVHSARLHSGEHVVVKIIRPDIKSVIQQDIALMYFLARILLFISKEAKRLRPFEVISDYQCTILDELDLQREAANASQLKRNFSDGNMLYVPTVYWEFCRTSVMVMERIDGISIADIDTLKSRGTDMKKLAELGTEIFFTQVFEHRFFHADMHPGNIFVDVSNPDLPRYLGVDFGIMGSLESEDQFYLAANLLAFFQRDYRKVAQLHIDSGWVSAKTSLSALEASIRSVCEPIFAKPIKDISFGHLLIRLFQVARRFDMVVQPQLVLLEKTLLNVEGLGRQLYPDLNLWETGQPFLERWIKKQINPCSLVKTIHKNIPDFLLNAPNVLHSITIYARQMSENQLQLQQEKKQQEQRKKKYRFCGVILVGLSVISWINPNFIEFKLLATLLVGSLGFLMIL